METNVTKEQIQAARKVDLHRFLLSHHPNEVLREGESIRLCCNHSVSIKEGYCGYTDFATGETGNAIDCLVNYFDYTLPDAVNALLADAGRAGTGTAAPTHDTGAGTGTQASGKEPGKPFMLPEISDSNIEMSNYLSGIRGLSVYVVGDLMIDSKVIYQERTHNNVVFVNPERNFAEIRGTNPKKPFHQVMYDDDPGAFWWFKKDGLRSDATVAYICESSIDAISLYCIHRIYQNPANGLYCSIAGVANQKRIDRIKAGMGAAGLPVVLAVDNDDAGEQCRQRNPDCNHATPPSFKDWNEMLLDIIRKEADRNPDLKRHLY